jgi:hypothetical protein
MVGPVDASYLADAIIMMRYFEADGEVRQALSVVKNAAAITSARSGNSSWAHPPESTSASRCATSTAC